MNKPIRRVSIAVIVLFTALVLNLNLVQVIRSEELSSNPLNTRVLLDEYSRQRGSIVAAGGTPIAVSTSTDDQLEYLRTYPAGPAYAYVTGFYSLVFGSDNIEQTENDILSGSDDRFFVRRVTDLFTGRDPKGGNVVLTIDPTAQQAAYDALGDSVGAVVALNPKTGAILAMASTPSFDPNQLSSHDSPAIRTYVDTLQQQNPLWRTNNGIDDNFPPGSLFKVIVAAAALESGQTADGQPYTPDTVIDAPDTLALGGAELENFDGGTCGPDGKSTLIHALTISCNTAFAQLGKDLGEDKLRAMAEKFGITGEGFAMPLRVAKSELGDIADPNIRAQASIGQNGVRLTTMQAAMIAATVANDGQLMQPYLIDELQAPDLSVLEKTDPQAIGDAAFSSDTANELTEMMVSVVNEGSGQAADSDSYEIAGKTGTAQTGNDTNDHAWFTGFAPADDPEIAVAVFLKNGGGQNSETTGGKASAPIAKAVIEAYLDAHGGSD